MTNLLEGAPSATSRRATPSVESPGRGAPPQDGSPPVRPGDLDALIGEAARNLADYQRLTAEGKLGEAGTRLEALKKTLDELQRRQPSRLYGATPRCRNGRSGRGASTRPSP